MFAHFFLIIYTFTDPILKLGIRNELYCSVYMVLWMMMLFCAYEAFVSFVILRLVCIMCTLLYATVALMLVSCKQALAITHEEIFRVLHSLFVPSFSSNILKKGLTAMMTAMVLSAIIAFGIDYALKTHFKKERSLAKQ